MNRRNVLKAAIAGVAAACGVKVAKRGPVIGLRIGESVVSEPFRCVLKPGKAPTASGASLILENEHGNFECTVTPD